MEYFTNRDVAGEDDFFDGIYDAQLTSREPDFFKLQYHVEGPEPDSINIYNRTVPAARGLLYGVSQPPAAIMDGLLGWHKASPTDSTFFNGNYAVIDEVEIDRRSLVDPLFNILLTVDPPAPGEESKVKGQVILEYADSLQSLSDALILNIALVDDDALVNYTDGTGAEAHRFVVRKLLLGNEGMLIQANWSYGQTQQITFEQNIDVPITSGGNQRLVVFVQDRYATNGSSRVIHQSLVSQPIQRQGVKPVGLEDDPIAAEVRSIQIYPNPANNVLKFNLQNQLTRHYTWKMIDQRGITVLDGDVNQFFDHPQEIDISKLANGIYFIQIGIGDTSIIYRKIAVMNRN